MNYDDDDELESYSTFSYHKDSNLINFKKTYTRDSKLRGDEDYKKLYLNYTDYFRKDSKIVRRNWYKMHEAPDELFYYQLFKYPENGNIIKENYNLKDEITRREIQNSQGKVISAKQFSWGN